MNMKCTKSVKEAIEFYLWLGVVAFMLVLGNGTKVGQVSLAIFTILR
jgi:hypothetical protein